MQLYTDHVGAVDNGHQKKTGKARTPKGSPKLLAFSRFLKTPSLQDKVPEAFDFWKRKKEFPIESFGNTQYGSCTKSSQAVATMRMERIEQRRTIDFDDEEIINNYLAMTGRLYGGGDTGAYELDALSEWRKPDLTFRDKKGRPQTIDAFVSLNPRNTQEIKQALYMSGGHGIKMCFALPAAWVDTYNWDIPEGQLPVGDYEPYTWGGHSMYQPARYTKEGLIIPHTWGVPDGFISWRAVAQYCDEAYLVIDSVNTWKKKKEAKNLDMPALVSAVNEVSSQRIKTR